MPRLVANLLGALVAVAALSGSASAQNAPPPAGSQTATPPQTFAASHLDAARELMETTGVLQPLDELIPTFSEQVLKQNVTRPELAKDLGEVLGTLRPELDLQRREVTNRVARIYARYLTEPECKELAAFFRTPLGIKYNKLQPDIVEDVVADVGIWTQEVSEYVMIRTRAEMGKRGLQMQ